MWMARLFGLPELIAVQIGDQPFPVLWSIIGGGRVRGRTEPDIPARGVVYPPCSRTFAGAKGHVAASLRDAEWAFVQHGNGPFR